MHSIKDGLRAVLSVLWLRAAVCRKKTENGMEHAQAIIDSFPYVRHKG